MAELIINTDFWYTTKWQPEDISDGKLEIFVHRVTTREQNQIDNSDSMTNRLVEMSFPEVRNFKANGKPITTGAELLDIYCPELMLELVNVLNGDLSTEVDQKNS